MASKELAISKFILHILVIVSSLLHVAHANSKLFREYIGAENQGVKFSDLPINPNIDFHFLLSFAIDYTNTSTPLPTNGNFISYWDTENLNPYAITMIKSVRPNVKVAVSLGGDTVNGQFVYFNASSIDSWVANAISSITSLVKEHGLDGIDIDYEHFQTDPDTFAECIGRLLCHLKENNIVLFTSIAPYGNESVQEHYMALWKKYCHVIDYVNFQFYAYPKNTSVTQFWEYFETQSRNYEGGKILLSFGTDKSGGLKPEHGFFTAASTLRSRGKIHGIFIWSADDSKQADFVYEKQAQDFLASR